LPAAYGTFDISAFGAVVGAAADVAAVPADVPPDATASGEFSEGSLPQSLFPLAPAGVFFMFSA
jgi:hypothetical protein